MEDIYLPLKNQKKSPETLNVKNPKRAKNLATKRPPAGFLASSQRAGLGHRGDP